MRNFFYALVGLGALALVFAATEPLELEGVVRGAQNMRLPGAEVRLREEGSSRVTDARGVFEWRTGLSSSLPSSSSAMLSSSSQVPLSSSRSSSARRSSSSSEVATALRASLFSQAAFLHVATGSLQLTVDRPTQVSVDWFAADGQGALLFSERLEAGSFRVDPLDHALLRSVSGTGWLRVRLGAFSEVFALSLDHGRLLRAARAGLPGGAQVRSLLPESRLAASLVPAADAVDTLVASAMGYAEARVPVLQYRQGDLGTLFLLPLPDPALPQELSVRYQCPPEFQCQVTYRRMTGPGAGTMVSAGAEGDSVFWSASLRRGGAVRLDSASWNGKRWEPLPHRPLSFAGVLGPGPHEFVLHVRRMDAARKVRLEASYDVLQAAMEVRDIYVRPLLPGVAWEVAESSLVAVRVTARPRFVLDEVKAGRVLLDARDSLQFLHMDHDTLLTASALPMRNELLDWEFALGDGLMMHPGRRGDFVLPVPRDSVFAFSLRLAPAAVVTATLLDGMAVRFDSLCALSKASGGQGIFACRLPATQAHRLEVSTRPADEFYTLRFPYNGDILCGSERCPPVLEIAAGQPLWVSSTKRLEPADLDEAVRAGRPWYPAGSSEIRASSAVPGARHRVTVRYLQAEDTLVVSSSRSRDTLFQLDYGTRFRFRVHRPGFFMAGYSVDGVYQTGTYEVSNAAFVVLVDGDKEIVPDFRPVTPYKVVLASGLPVGSEEVVFADSSWYPQRYANTLNSFRVSTPKGDVREMSLEGVPCLSSSWQSWVCPVYSAAEYGGAQTLRLDYRVGPRPAVQLDSRIDKSLIRVVRPWIPDTVTLAQSARVENGSTLLLSDALLAGKAGERPFAVQLGGGQFVLNADYVGLSLRQDVDFRTLGLQDGQNAELILVSHAVPREVRFLDASADADFYNGPSGDTRRVSLDGYTLRPVFPLRSPITQTVCVGNLATGHAGILRVLGQDFALEPGGCATVDLSPLTFFSDALVEVPLEFESRQRDSVEIVAQTPVPAYYIPYPRALAKQGATDSLPLPARVVQGQGALAFCVEAAKVAEYGTARLGNLAPFTTTYEAWPWRCYATAYDIPWTAEELGGPLPLRMDYSPPPPADSIDIVVKVVDLPPGLRWATISYQPVVDTSSLQTGDTLRFAANGASRYTYLCPTGEAAEEGYVRIRLDDHRPVRDSLYRIADIKSCVLYQLQVPPFSDVLTLSASRPDYDLLEARLADGMTDHLNMAYFKDAFTRQTYAVDLASGQFPGKWRADSLAGSFCVYYKLGSIPETQLVVAGKAFTMNAAGIMSTRCATISPLELSGAAPGGAGELAFSLGFRENAVWPLVLDPASTLTGLQSWAVETNYDETTCPQCYYLEAYSNSPMYRELVLKHDTTVQVEAVYLDGQPVTINDNYRFSSQLTLNLPNITPSVPAGSPLSLRVVMRPRYKYRFVAQATWPATTQVTIQNQKLDTANLPEEYGYMVTACATNADAEHSVTAIVLGGVSHAVSSTQKGIPCTYYISPTDLFQRADPQSHEISVDLVFAQSVTLDNNTGSPLSWANHFGEAGPAAMLYKGQKAKLRFVPPAGQRPSWARVGSVTYGPANFVLQADQQTYALAIDALPRESAVLAVDMGWRSATAQLVVAKKSTGAGQLSLDACATLLPWDANGEYSVPELTNLWLCGFPAGTYRVANATTQIAAQAKVSLPFASGDYYTLEDGKLVIRDF